MLAAGSVLMESPTSAACVCVRACVCRGLCVCRTCCHLITGHRWPQLTLTSRGCIHTLLYFTTRSSPKWLRKKFGAESFFPSKGASQSCRERLLPRTLKDCLPCYDPSVLPNVREKRPFFSPCKKSGIWLVLQPRAPLL